MGILNRKNQQPASRALDKVVDSLPRQVADWTPEQRATYTAAADRATREQADQQTQQR
ncbi:hypothetical protein [Streptomyces sp. NPDC048392]|uniref:hypothetical protein n=1 Tax=Streptomyces sp. NPDC048392 TaxID=3365543 RepID=UPI0037183572